MKKDILPTPSRDFLWQLGEDWRQLRSGVEKDAMTILFLREKFAQSNIHREEPDARERLLDSLGVGMYVFNNPALDVVREIWSQLKDFLPEELRRKYPFFFGLLLEPYRFTAGASVFTGAIIDLSYGNEKLGRLDNLLLSCRRAMNSSQPVRLKHVIPLVSKWLGAEQELYL